MRSGILRYSSNLVSLHRTFFFALFFLYRLSNSQEHHGLHRSLDVGLDGYRRHMGYSVLSDNLHVIGRELLVRVWVGSEKVRAAA